MLKIFPVVLVGILTIYCTPKKQMPLLDHQKIASTQFGNDTSWFLNYIPFFECSDKQIEDVYYYRWKLYKAHIRNVGTNEYVITEFINDMSWDIDPYSTINAATMHHIYEGRWLKDNRYMDGYINYMYQQGGNNRQYSESIADAAYARFLVNSDSTFLMRQLDSMMRIYDGWSDHYDSARSLYFIPAMPDATEYTIASIDASGGKDGFEDGEAFRPTINSYMYGNALAISRIAEMKGDSAVSHEYLRRAENLKSNIEKSLWNDSLEHFIDRYKVDNQYVHNWDFIRGRELAGYAPWYFDLPDNTAKFNAAWKHAIDTTQLLGKYGLRTNEPSYQYYFTQFTFSFGKPGSQWNGPSWPYQSSQVITAMGNFLNDYNQQVVSVSDYLHVLRQFTLQHYLPDGRIDLVENYDPNLGGPIVYFYWSNHYNHSTYNNLIISGLCGIRPSAGETLRINPLIDESIQYFCLDDLLYHGHHLTVVYDKDGSKYGLGSGLTVFVDGKKKTPTQNASGFEVNIGTPIVRVTQMEKENFALNIYRHGYPEPSASVNVVPDSIYQAIDGRIWYFPEITNQWTTKGSGSTSDWYALDFGKTQEISELKISFYADDRNFAIPDNMAIEYRDNGDWQKVELKENTTLKLVKNTSNTIPFEKENASGIRVTFDHQSKDVAVVELGCY